MLNNGLKIVNFEYWILSRKDSLQVREGATLFTYVYPHFNLWTTWPILTELSMDIIHWRISKCHIF